MQRLGFVGLGAMGLPMAKRLTGFELGVFDVLDERVRPLVEYIEDLELEARAYQPLRHGGAHRPQSHERQAFHS